MKKTLNPLLIFFIILVEGFISIGIEILTIRETIPYTGSNVMNTSIIIGIFLLFLSVGYYKGGKIKNESLNVLITNLKYSLLIFVIGFSFIFLEVFFHLSKPLGLMSSLIIYTLLITAPIIFLLGQTIPIVIKHIKDRSISEVNGLVLFISTIGSFLGSIITTTLLINFLGVDFTIFIYINMFILLIWVIYFNIPDRKNIISILIITIISFLIGIIQLTENNYIYKNNHSSLKIYEKEGVRYLNINNSNSSSYDLKANKSDFDYINKMSKVVSNISNEKKDILVIGSGGFTLSLDDKLNKYTYLDIDKDIKEVVEKKFLNNKIEHKFIGQDVRAFFTENEQKYDVLVLDAFSNRITIPPFLLTLNFLEQLHKHLNKDGYLLINYIGNPLLKTDYSFHYNQTVNTFFNCMTDIGKIDKDNTNILYICKQKDGIIYTDKKINLFELISY